MTNTFLISDTHFGHANIIKYCNRPFSSTQEMDETLIENWNKVVKPQDKIYHLGDVYFGKGCKPEAILRRLNGTKVLIVGNHDHIGDPILTKYFSRIYMWRQLKEHGLLLSHVPLHPSALFVPIEKGIHLKNIHGHIHDQDSPKDKTVTYVNISVEKTDYKPISIEDVK